MEQNENIGNSIVENDSKRAWKGLKIAVAVVSVVAVCGIGFGIYSAMQNVSKDNQISDLKVQLENVKNENKTLENNTDAKENETSNISVTDENKNFAIVNFNKVLRYV